MAACGCSDSSGKHMRPTDSSLERTRGRNSSGVAGCTGCSMQPQTAAGRLHRNSLRSLLLALCCLLLVAGGAQASAVEKCLLFGLRFNPPMTRQVTDASKILECQQLCLDAEGWGCSYFGFAPDWKGCWLANETTHPEVNMWTEHFVGGFAECPSDWKDPCKELPNGELFAKSPAAAHKVWPSTFQPAAFQCWPRTADYELEECGEATMIEDLNHTWTIKCTELQEIQTDIGSTCKEECRTSSACAAWQEIWDDHVGGSRCFHGLGQNCWKEEFQRAGWGQKVTSAGRFLHGSYRVLRDLRGVYVKNLTQAFPTSRFGTSEASLEPALAACKSLCLSKLRCQFWLYSASEGCRYQAEDYMETYPWTEAMVEFDSAAAHEVVAGEVIQRTCSKALPGKLFPASPPLANQTWTPPPLPPVPTLAPLPPPPTLPPMTTMAPVTVPPLTTLAPVNLPPVTTMAPATLPPMPTAAPLFTTTTTLEVVLSDVPTTTVKRSPVHSAAESIATPTAIATEDRFVRAVPSGEMYFEDVKTHSKHLVRDTWACKVCEPTPKGCSDPVDLPEALVDGLPTSEDFNCEMLSSSYIPAADTIDGITFTSTSTTTMTTTTTTTTWKFMGDAGGMKYGWLWALLVFLCCGLGGLGLHFLAGVGRSSRKKRQRDEKKRQKQAARDEEEDDEEASFSPPPKAGGMRHSSSGEEGQSLLAPSATSSAMPPTPVSQGGAFLPPTQAAVVASAGYGGVYGYAQQQGWSSAEMPPTVTWGQPQQMPMTSVGTGQMGAAGSFPAEEYDLVTVLPNGEIQVTPLT